MYLFIKDHNSIWNVILRFGCTGSEYFKLKNSIDYKHPLLAVSLITPGILHYSMFYSLKMLTENVQINEFSDVLLNGCPFLSYNLWLTLSQSWFNIVYMRIF